MKCCGNCANVECRCSDCYALAEVKGEWYCDIAGAFCKDVETCLEYENVLVDDDACNEEV